MSQLKCILLNLLIVFIPNILMFLLAYLVGAERSLVNVDYFITLLFLVINQRILFVLAFFIIFFIDFLGIFSQIFPFIRIYDIFYLLKFSFISSTTYKLYGCFLVCIFILQSWLIVKNSQYLHAKTLLVMFNIFILIYAYEVNFQESQNNTISRRNADYLVVSQTINYIEFTKNGFVQNYNSEGNAFADNKVTGATADLFNTLPTHQKVLLIVNESWGEPVNPSIQQQVLQPLLSDEKLLNIKRGRLDFTGFTIAGELRELCQKSPIHFNLKDTVNGFGGCLPHRFVKHGYQTTAVHGALSLMYDRRYWYPRAGFKKMLFRDQGLNLPESYCYSFPGNCDRDIAKKIDQEFQTDGKQFIYWLTLNTHATYDERDLMVDYFQCDQFKIRQDSMSCRNLKLQTQFFDTLSQLVNSPNLRGAKVIVVGDHEPPIIENETSVYKVSTVPFIEFEVADVGQ
ncbi:sulfatase-like hydrolase/transferase [Acinetobacter sp. 1207_04]|uniref:sulfatase-like hydrolase/transferase n=1 Tax=Acinetobacter sp. 1207_04 TaxID=2604449 RepID=UPI0040594D78